MQTVLLLHGALGSSKQLHPIRETLEAKNFRVLEFNFSGHGGVPFQSDFGIEQFADEIEQLLTETISQFTIFGYSMGGYVAIWFALKRPELVSRIITLGTKFDWTPASAEREINKMDPDKIEIKVPAFARILEHRHHPNNWKELMRKTAAMMEQLGNKPLLVEQNLKLLKSKVTILLGDQDDMADLNYSKQVVAWIPQSEFVLLQNTPHPIEKVDHSRISEFILDTEY